MRGDRQLILVVDDELPITMSLQQLLSKCNYRVLTAENGREGLLVYEEHQTEISLFITDTMMPVMGGLEFVRHLRRPSPSLSIIATTASNRKPSAWNISAVACRTC